MGCISDAAVDGNHEHFYVGFCSTDRTLFRPALEEYLCGNCDTQKMMTRFRGHHTDFPNATTNEHIRTAYTARLACSNKRDRRG